MDASGFITDTGKKVPIFIDCPGIWVVGNPAVIVYHGRALCLGILVSYSKVQFLRLYNDAISVAYDLIVYTNNLKDPF